MVTLSSVKALTMASNPSSMVLVLATRSQSASVGRGKRWYSAAPAVICFLEPRFGSKDIPKFCLGGLRASCRLWDVDHFRIKSVEGLCNGDGDGGFLDQPGLFDGLSYEQISNADCLAPN